MADVAAGGIRRPDVGFVKILRAPGFRSQYRQPLMRIAAVSVVFAVVCELVLLSGTGAS